MPFESPQLGTGRDIPQLDGPVRAAAGEGFAVGAEDD